MRDAITVIDDEILATMIDQDNADFPAVVGIDRTWRIDQADSASQGKPGTGTHLPLEPRGNGQGDAGRHQYPIAAFQNQRLIERRIQVHAGSQIGHVARHVGIAAKALDLDSNVFHHILSKPSGSSGETQFFGRVVRCGDFTHHLDIERFVLEQPLRHL